MIKTLPFIFILIAFIGIGFFISMLFGMFGTKNENTNENDLRNINDFVTELRQNQSLVVIVINNNTINR